MDISVRTEAFGVEDRSWLGSAHGTNATRPITLDPALFTASTHYPAGYIPSGMVLAKVTATGLHGPYNNTLTNGQETAAGHLFNSVKVKAGSTTKQGAPLMEHGFVVEAKLPTNHGLDSAAKTDLAGRVQYR